MRISLGVVIGIILIVYWYMKDHPRVAPPATQGSAYNYVIGNV